MAMGTKRKKRLIELIRRRLDKATTGEMPEANIVVAVSLLTELVEDLIQEVEHE